MKINRVAPLLIYDCVLLFHAQDEQGQNYMFSHVDVCEGECEYIAVPTDEVSLTQYLAGEIDLRELMLTKGREAWYSARLTENPGERILEQQHTELSESTSLPGKGFHHDPRFRSVESREYGAQDPGRRESPGYSGADVARKDV